MRDLVQESFHGESGVRMAHRTPPLHGNADSRAVQIDLQVRYAVEYVSGAFDRSAVEAVFNCVRLEWRPLHNRLPHDCVGPNDRIAAHVQARDDTVVPHRPVPTASYII